MRRRGEEVPEVLREPRRERLTSIVVGPGREGELRAQLFVVGPDVEGIESVVKTARSVSVGPIPSLGTGAVGWQEVDVPLRDGSVIAAIVYYPAGPDEQGRLWSHENADIGTTAGGWPMLVIVHGQGPGEIGSTDRDCGDVDPDDPLYHRWRSIQMAMAHAGYVSIAPDRSDDRWSAAESVTDVARWLRGAAEFGSAVAPERVGLIGHSVGASNVSAAAETVGARAVAVLGPARFRGGLPPPPNLTIGAESDTNRDPETGESTSVVTFRRARAPRHLVLLDPDAYAHFAFLDGYCGEQSSEEDAERQRTLSHRVLRRFFDRYLRGTPMPGDLGVSNDDPAVDRVCFDLEIDGDEGGEQCPEDE